MDPTLLVIVAAMAALLLGTGSLSRWRRRRAEAALRETRCLLCESRQVAHREGSAHQRCTECGFDTELADDARVGQAVGKLRAVRAAVEALQVADMRLAETPDLSGSGIIGAAAGGRYERLGDANVHITQAAEHLEALGDPEEGPEDGIVERLGDLIADIQAQDDLSRSRGRLAVLTTEAEHIRDALREEIRAGMPTEPYR